ncbi:hypothetical protein [uncultured Parasphingorhabdus sp.]|uniref:hypothetical protein n=1 Tax=uncultured Parasphingorhabdus sp. TaxID=2709694 RepID=UPI0030D928EB|tara:strand:- start:5488 stop:5805 length:318 start_codon:yes stop_codon:yes gene_type:complete
MKLTTDELKRVKSIIEIDEKNKIVIIDEYKVHENGPKKNYNVYKINEYFEILWQIAPSIPPRFEYETFSFFGEATDGELTVQTFGGDEFLLNIDTGEARFLEWHK